MENNNEMVERLAKCTVQDETGQAVNMGSLWQDQTAVLVFVRHFG